MIIILDSEYCLTSFMTEYMDVNKSKGSYRESLISFFRLSLCQYIAQVNAHAVHLMR